MGSSEYWADYFFRLSVRLLRNWAYPSIGVAAAQALVVDGASIVACLGTALGIFLFIIGIALICFFVSFFFDSRP